ncbi:MAG: zinc-ribbon domain-containing protein [Muribaculaceae bacterium]|nr:zinc-ribbon domain-containing protein [Muribaculaceae bacterium]
MELECPQCSKRVQVSAEELALHSGAVVCPQCLSVFDASGEIPAGTTPVRGGKPTQEHLSYAYCPHCGRKIPQGVNFCPYCGQELAAVGHKADDTPPPATSGDAPGDNDSHDEPAQTHGSRHHDSTSHDSGSSRRSSGSGHSSRSRHGSGDRTGKQRQLVMPSYRYAKLTGWHIGSQKASPLFAAIAWLVIAALIALLVFIIYKVNLLM